MILPVNADDMEFQELVNWLINKAGYTHDEAEAIAEYVVNGEEMEGVVE